MSHKVFSVYLILQDNLKTGALSFSSQLLYDGHNRNSPPYCRYSLLMKFFWMFKLFVGDLLICHLICVLKYIVHVPLGFWEIPAWTWHPARDIHDCFWLWRWWSHASLVPGKLPLIPPWLQSGWLSGVTWWFSEPVKQYGIFLIS